MKNFFSELISDLKKISFQPGVASYIVLLMVLGGGFTLMLSFSFLIVNELAIGRSALNSMQAYYAAEAGLEDILLRIQPGRILPSSPHVLTVASSSATVTIGPLLGGTRGLIADGKFQNQIRRVAVTATIATEQAQFFFGAQVGDGGLEMDNGSQINGNIFSNGSAFGQSGIKPTITGTIKVARNGNKIQDFNINQDAYAHTLQNCTVGGIIFFVSGGSPGSCTADGGIQQQPNEIDPIPLPLGQGVIDGWKTDAALGGTISPPSISGNGVVVNLGPVKVAGDLTVSNNAILNVTGTIWVTGDLTIRNNGTINLDSTIYGPLSGILIVDGKIRVRPNVTIEGSGDPNSFIMLLSESTSIDPIDPAIDVDNNVQSVILYTNNGMILLHNGVEVQEAAAYKLKLDNNAAVSYNSGLADVSFSSGPSGGWAAVSWQEVQ